MNASITQVYINIHHLSSLARSKHPQNILWIFSSSGLNITVECNLQITDFLDVTFNLRTDNIMLTEKITTSYSTLINNQTTYQLSPKKYHQPSAGEYCNKEYFIAIKNTLIKLHAHIIMHLKLVASIKIFNSRQHPHQEGTVTERSYGSIHHIMSTRKQTSVEYFYDSLTSTSHDIINTASFSIKTISRSVTVVR